MLEELAPMFARLAFIAVSSVTSHPLLPSILYYVYSLSRGCINHVDSSSTIRQYRLRYVHKIRIVCFVIASSAVVHVSKTTNAHFCESKRRYYLINHWNIRFNVHCRNYPSQLHIFIYHLYDINNIPQTNSNQVLFIFLNYTFKSVDLRFLD